MNGVIFLAVMATFGAIIWSCLLWRERRFARRMAPILRDMYR